MRETGHWGLGPGNRSPRRRHRALRCSALRLLPTALLLGGCYQRMEDQPRVDPYEQEAFFQDSLGMRQVPDGTVYRGQIAQAALSGIRASGSASDSGATGLRTAFPFPVTAAVVARGRERYEIACAPCHGRTGYGNGMVVQRGVRPPPSYHTDRLRQAPAGHVVDVIARGYGAMYSYADRVEPADRWAIAAYIRALQRSQNAAPADVPPAVLAELATTPAPRGDAPFRAPRPGELP